MKKTTVARILATAASTAGAIVCPQLLANQYADVAVKAGVATLLSCIPDGASTLWKKSKEYEVTVGVEHTKTAEVEAIPTATVEQVEITASTTGGVKVDQTKVKNTPTGNKS